MAMPAVNTEKAFSSRSKLNEQDAIRILEIFSDLTELCAKLTGEIDPAAMTILRQVVNDMLPETKTILKKLNQSSS
jgi:hypothetical protein